MEPLPRNKNNPIPFVDKNKFNSLLFLARLLKTNDHLSPKDICSLQQVEPHFRLIMQNINRNQNFVMDKNNILFKKIKKQNFPEFFVLCLPAQFAISVINTFHEVAEMHVPRGVMIAHYNLCFYTP